MSSEFNQQIDKLLEKAPENRHSYFQLKYFVIGKEPTTQAQMWQCLRELRARKEAMELLQFEIDETKDQLELHELEEYRNLAPNVIEIRKRQHERKKDSMQRSLARSEQKLKFAEQEARFFVQAFEALSKLEPLKDYDDFQSQAELYNEKVSQEINLKVLLRQPLDNELIKTALSLPDGVPVKVETIKMLDRAHDQQTKRINAQDIKS